MEFKGQRIEPKGKEEAIIRMVLKRIPKATAMKRLHGATSQDWNSGIGISRDALKEKARQN